MSPTGSSSLGPLSVGNVVNAGVRIYRSHLRQFFMLALLAYAWLLIPVVDVLAIVALGAVLFQTIGSDPTLIFLGGSIAVVTFIFTLVYASAKFSTISAQISRLTFQELMNQPESSAESRRYTNPRMWRFFLAGLLIGLIFSGLIFGAFIVLSLLGGLIGVLASGSTGLAIFGVLLVGIAAIVLAIALIRIWARLFIFEVPLAVEPQLGAVSTISRSWDLTNGAASRIQWVVVIGFLITLLVILPIQLASFLVQAATTANAESGLVAILSLLLVVVSAAANIFTLPFWQVIKAVIYYDLRSRREGLGLELRGRQR